MELIYIIEKIILCIICSFASVGLIIAIFYCYTRKRIPRLELNKERQNNLIRFGLLHFANQQEYDRFKKSPVIHRNTTRQLYFGEKYLSWFFLCDQVPNETYVDTFWSEMREMQPNATICIHIKNIDNKELINFLYSKKTGYIAHVGSLNCSEFDIYEKDSEGWIKR